MKTLLLLISIFALYSCMNSAEPNTIQDIEIIQGSFQDFESEFEGYSPLWVCFDDLKIVEEKGEIFDIRKYKNLFEEEVSLKGNIEEVLTIAYFPNVKRHENFELFVITSNNRYYVLTADKTKEKIVQVLEIPEDYTLFRFHFDKLYAEEGEEVELTCRSSKLGKWSNYSKETLLNYENIYYFTEEGQFVFNHTNLDREASLKSLPTLNKISGEYSVKNELYTFSMTVRDSTAIGTVPIDIYTHDTKSGCVITYEADDKIQGNKLIHIKDDKVCFELTFMDEEVHVFLRECIEECENAYCDVKMIAEKIE